MPHDCNPQEREKMEARKTETTIWNPIDTAPKDGREILLGRFLNNGKWKCYVSRFNGYWTGQDARLSTHWMEIPKCQKQERLNGKNE